MGYLHSNKIILSPNMTFSGEFNCYYALYKVTMQHEVPVFALTFFPYSSGSVSLFFFTFNFFELRYNIHVTLCEFKVYSVLI